MQRLGSMEAQKNERATENSVYILSANVSYNRKQSDYDSKAGQARWSNRKTSHYGLFKASSANRGNDNKLCIYRRFSGGYNNFMAGITNRKDDGIWPTQHQPS